MVEYREPSEWRIESVGYNKNDGRPVYDVRVGTQDTAKYTEVYYNLMYVDEYNALMDGSLTFDGSDVARVKYLNADGEDVRRWMEFKDVQLAECCPFCGSVPEIRRVSAGAWHVGCHNHNCIADRITNHSISLEVCVDRWNQRF